VRAFARGIPVGSRRAILKPGKKTDCSITQQTSRTVQTTEQVVSVLKPRVDSQLE